MSLLPSEEKQITPEPNMEASEPILKSKSVARREALMIQDSEVLAFESKEEPKKKRKVKSFEEQLETPELLEQVESVKDKILEVKAEFKKIKSDCDDILLGFKEKMNTVIANAISKAESEKAKVLNIRYEYLYIDEAKFRVPMIDEYSSKGWKFICFVDEKLAKTYVHDRGFALFERVKK